jgi:hypothetical protein
MKKMKKLLFGATALLLFGCSQPKSTSTTFTPTFIGVQGQYCGVIPTINADGSIDFREGRVQSTKKYKNITKITATVDISGLNNINWVNATFYMVNGGSGYCDAGGTSTYCNEIDFMETNGNVLSQSTIHLGSNNSDKKESLEFAYLNSINTNSCWKQDYLSNPGPGVNNSTTIDPTKPFNITIEFPTDYTNMTVTYSQGSNSVVVYDFKSQTKANDSSIDNLDDLKATMENGWSIVAAYWQGWSPDENLVNGNQWYNYNDPACAKWSSVCDGTFKISNIKVIAESEL